MKHQQAKWGLLGLLALSGLAVLQGILAQRAAAVYQAQLDLLDRLDRLAQLDRGEPLERQEIRGPRAIRDPWVQQGRMGPSDPWGLPVNAAWRGSPVRPENQERRGPWDRWDL